MSASSPNPSLLAVFHESYHDLVRFVARRAGPQAARDLVHDAWLRVAERTAEGAPGTPGATPPDDPQEHLRWMKAYLYTVANHLAIDHLRHGQRTVERFDPDIGHEDAPPAPGTADVADVHAYRQALVEVERTLQQLPVRCRDIFLADRIDGTSHAELAARHGVSIKTVEREVMRAMDGVEASLQRWRGEAVVPRTGRRRALSALLGVAGLGLGSAAFWQAWRHGVPQYQAALSSPMGRLLTQPLPDGSTLTLDAQSRAQVRYTAARRSVQLLAGSAFFAVASAPDRPFVVQAQGVRITVLGTRFEVALLAGGVQVAVEEGHVRVEDAASGLVQELAAGDRLRVAPGRPAEREALADAVAPWRDGWLEFRNLPLAEAVERLARYSAVPLQVAPDAAQLPVLARVRIAQARQWLRLLPVSLPVVLHEPQGPGGAIVIARR